MKLSDYVASFVAEQNVKDVFLISGGGMMHLLDSFGKNKDLNLICNLNEQACSICSDSYGQYTNNLGVCLLTTGPGGTNAMTGVAASYLDSVPVLVISGQCKTADAADLRGVRQFGAQEVDVISMAKPITKYSVKITDQTTIRYHLEKAVYLAKEGRQGPVWIDIPLDMQGADIQVDELEAFSPPTKKMDQNTLGKEISKVYTLIKAAKRPLFLIGGGAVCKGNKEPLRDLVEQLQIPVLTTWRAKDFLCENHPLYFGMPGAPAYRYSNNVLQNCDLLIVIGTRLNPSITLYDEKNFAKNAKKIIVDIDKNEIDKLDMDFNLIFQMEAADFTMVMTEKGSEVATKQHWLDFCNTQKEKYPLHLEKQPYDNEGKTDGYVLAKAISEHSLPDDVLVGSSSGRACGISHIGFFLKEGQRFITSMGLGSMGFTIPSAISSCIASGKKRVIALEGDGSLQHNIQELQLIRTYQLPIKLFILSNEGYASIYMMQKTNFGANFVGAHNKSGLAFPKVSDLAKTYHLDYYTIHNDNEVEKVVSEMLSNDRPAICEVISSIYFDEIPKSKTTAHSDGTFSSSSLENLYPFLSSEEVKENMLNSN